MLAQVMMGCNLIWGEATSGGGIICHQDHYISISSKPFTRISLRIFESGAKEKKRIYEQTVSEWRGGGGGGGGGGG